MFRKMLEIIKKKLRLNLMLSLLIKERYKMLKASKIYAKKYPEGTIQYHKSFNEFIFSSLKDENILLFVVYAPKSLLMYDRFFQLFEKLDYKIVIIANSGLSSEFVERFKNKVVLIAERYNIGRDFGAYKEFICKLRREDAQPKNLIICNDSIFANLKQDDTRFTDFLVSNQNEDFVGAAEYMGVPGYHLQSYFLKFSQTVLNSTHFIKFWDEFLISDDRRLNIHNGEIKLSESILKGGFKPVVFLNTDCIVNKIVDDKQKLEKFLIETSANKHLNPHLIGGLKNLSLNFYARRITPEHKAYFSASLKLEITRLIDRFGVIVVCPYFIIDEFGFPFLKRDLVYRQVTEWGLIREFGKNFDQDLLDEYINDQRIRRRLWNLPTLKDKLMYHTGMN